MLTPEQVAGYQDLVDRMGRLSVNWNHADVTKALTALIERIKCPTK